MSKPFTVKPFPEIRFGAGKFSDLSDILIRFGNTTLILTGSNSFAETVHWQQLQKSLLSKRIKFNVEKIIVEPSPEIVDTIVQKYCNDRIDSIVAIGGGSALDAGKAVSAMLPEGRPVAQFLEGVGNSSPDGSKVPFVAVPTTSGTGSEATSNAVISRVGKDGFKKSLRHDNYIPNVAVVDPILTLQCPQRLTVNCAMDCFTQLVESYLSTKGSPFTDDLALGAIKKVKQSLMRVCQGVGEIEDRSNISYGALISGITLANAGLGVVHGFASVIGGLFPIPHGVVCCTLMAAVNEATLKKLRRSEMGAEALYKYTRLGQIFSDKKKVSSDYYQDFFIEELNRITSILQVELLSDYGIKLLDVQTIAQQTGCKNNPVEFDDKELQEILVKRIG